jgi:hypothetical protein
VAQAVVTSRSAKDIESYSAGVGGMEGAFGGAVHAAAGKK